STSLQQTINNLHHQVSLLNGLTSLDALLIGMDVHKEVVEGRKEQREWHKSEENDKIFRWLTQNSVDYGKQHSDFFDKLQEGTGQWLLESAEFNEWCNGDSLSLLYQGIPAAGKTMIACRIIDHLNSTYMGDPNVGVAYIYCNFRRNDEQSSANLLASLVAQLAKLCESMPIDLELLYERHSKKSTRPSVSELSGRL